MITHHTIVIVGPTASGKSDLAILLARTYNGEIVSADSRQVYRGMDVGTGKVSKDFSRKSKTTAHPAGGKNQKLKFKKEEFFSEGIKHHLLDVASPKRTYNVIYFIRDAKKALADIRKRNKVPIICGGTGFWIQALIEDSTFPAVKPNVELRKALGKLPTEKLFLMLQKKDPRRASSIDQHNKVRLIRALEVIATLGQVPSLLTNYKLQTTNYVIIALNPTKKILQKNIKTRLEKRLKKGMLAEIKKLRASGLSWRRLESFGLEYKYVALFLQKNISKETMRERIYFESLHYAKRQITWLKRFEKMGAHIHWISNPKEAPQIIEKNN